MKNHPKLIYKVWDSHENYIAPQSNPLEKVNFDELVGSFFCPASFYYYVIDFPTREFDMVSSHVNSIFGVPPHEYRLDTLMEHIHPDDLGFVMQCEHMVADFIVNKVSPEQVLKYKINYCLRLRTKDGQYKLFLHQALALSTGKNGELDKVLGIHSDVSHIIPKNNHKISFIGLHGEPSYLEMDVFSESKYQVSLSDYHFTKRELEILRLFSEGLTAKEISDMLDISHETVRSHRKNMFAKTGVSNIVELIAYGVRNGII